MKQLDRRQMLKGLGLGLLAAPLINACTSTSSEDVGTDAGSAGTDASSTGTGSGSGSSDPAQDWATGGTASMTAKSSYPDPFTAAATSCSVITAVTEGPCTTVTSMTREDVSDGWTGLPVRLGIRLIDASCNAVVGASVKIWHTNLAGSYSGVTPNPSMCLKDQSYSSAFFMRGTQVSDADGVVYFDTCFPGWYRGRAVHIHFQVTSAGGQAYKVSQLFFPEDLTTYIFGHHSEYTTYGQPDTTFATDNVMAGIPSASQAQNILEYSKMTDGAMLAWKTVSVTS